MFEWIHTIEIGLLVYFSLSLLWSYALMIGAWRMLKHPDPLYTPEGPCPLVSVLIPAYNEEKVILASVDNTLNNFYANLEVCICDDGSTDNTAQTLIDHFSMTQDKDDPRVWVSPWRSVKLFVSPKNTGRAGALNHALSLAQGTYCIATDADTIIDRDGILKMVRTIMTPGKKYGAVGGTLLLANEIVEHPMGLDWHAVIGKSWIAGTQAVEYMRAFLYGRLGLNRLGGNVIVSGAFGLFKTDLVRDLGGWNEESVAEDFDITTRIRESGWSAYFLPEPIAWTQAPPDLRSLGNQRSRWHRGLTEIFFRGPGKTCMFKHGALGKWVLPVHFFVEWLAPIMEILGLFLVITHIFHGEHMILLAPIMVAGYLLNILLSLISIKFEKDNYDRYHGSYARGVKYALLEPFWFRPFMIYWRLRGLWEYITGKKGWGGTIKRQAFAVLTSLLLLVASPAYPQWAETTVSTEVGQVTTRTDAAIVVNMGKIEVDGLLRTREQDFQQSVGVAYRVEPSARLRVIVSSDISTRGVILPRRTHQLLTSFQTGPWVLAAQFDQQLLQDDVSVELYSLQVDHYISTFRFGLRGMIGADDIHAGTIYIQNTTENFDLTLYASQGNEVLDIPLLIGENRVIGSTVRVPITRTLGLLIGANIGERAGKSYNGMVAGLRLNF